MTALLTHYFIIVFVTLLTFPNIVAPASGQLCIKYGYRCLDTGKNSLTDPGRCEKLSFNGHKRWRGFIGRRCRCRSNTVIGKGLLDNLLSHLARGIEWLFHQRLMSHLAERVEHRGILEYSNSNKISYSELKHHLVWILRHINTNIVTS